MASGKVAKAGNGADAAPAPRRKPGRAPGSPKVPGSGRRKGVPNAMGREARVYLAAESGYLDMIARVCSGKPIRMSGPTGRKTWYHPDWQDRKWAIELVASKCVPTMSAAEVSGPDGESLVPAMYSMPDKEIARRCALILTLADEAASPEAAEDGSSGGGPISRRSAGGEDTAVGETPPPSGASASSPNRSNGAGDPGGGRKDRADDVGDPNPTQSENFSKDAKPTEPQPGQAARCAGFIIRCTEASRPGLPNQYQILDGSGQLQSMAVNGWSDALRWIKARVGDDADMSIDIIRPAPTAEPIRPDQRQFAVGGPDIEVLRGYEDRKS